MNERDFEFWLQTTYVSERGSPLDPRSISSTRSNCRRVEKHFGDLDSHFDRDRCESLLERLLRSGLRVVGNAEHLDASLRSAVALYVKFRSRSPLRSTPTAAAPVGATRAATGAMPGAVRSRTAPSGEWPQWPQPDESAVLRLAQVVTPLVRMLHPDIVRAVVEDNRRNADRWSVGLRSRGVTPSTYLWDGCACAFPGVRRYAGSKEIAEFRGHGAGATIAPSGALRLDDNDFPKHLWSFVFRGRPFQKFGPDGYALAHLADHKDHGNRRGDELDGPSATTTSWFGLYTSAANCAYAPVALVKPTDLSALVRSLLLRRAVSLYGEFCALLPLGWKVRPEKDSRWSLSAFEWSDPVGTTESVKSFLSFRERTVEELLRGRSAP